MGEARSKQTFVGKMLRKIPAPMVKAESLEIFHTFKSFKSVIGQFGSIGEELFKMIEMREFGRRLIVKCEALRVGINTLQSTELANGLIILKCHLQSGRQIDLCG